MDKIYIIFSLISVIFNMKIIPNIPEDSTVKYRGEYLYEIYKLEYGDITQNPKNSDGLLVITNLESEEEVIVTYDNYGYETMRYIADVGNGEFIGICEEYYYSGSFEIPMFKNTMLIKYNILGEELEKFMIDYKPLRYNNHNNYLILVDKENEIHYYDSNFNEIESIVIEEEYFGTHRVQYQGNLYINGELSQNSNITFPGNYQIQVVNAGYSFEYSIVLNPKVLIEGNKYEDFFISDVFVYSSGDIYINNVVYKNGTKINIPGNYTITILGVNDYSYEKMFVIIPVITYFDGKNTSDFIDNLVIDSEITIFSNGISMLVNQELYNSSIITQTGEYQLIVSGINNLQITLNFYIYPTVTGITDKNVYDSVTFRVFGDGVLNGKTVTGTITVDEPGDYQLDLIYEDNIYCTYEFTIQNLTEEVIEINEKYKYLTYVFALLIAVGGYFILRKK